MSHWLDGGYTPVYHTNLEKFAELIVRECVNICISNRDDDSADHIEKHFGVDYG